MIEHSKYKSGDGRREAKVYMEKGIFYVTCKSEFGIFYTSSHEKLVDAENYAKEWVTTYE